MKQRFLSCLQQKYGIKVLKVLHFDDANAKGTRTSNKLEPSREIFKIWNQYL